MPNYLSYILCGFVAMVLLVSCAPVRTDDTTVIKKWGTSQYKGRSYRSYYNFSLSMLAYHNNDLRLAIKHMKVAERSDPGSPHIKYALAQLYTAVNRVSDAKKKLEQAIKLNPRHLESYKLLGKIVSTSPYTKDKKMAERYFRKAIDIDPSDANSYLFLALHYIREGNNPKAATFLKKTISIDPDDENALLFLAEILIKEKNIQEAKSLYLKLLKVNPKNFVAILALASIEETQGNFKKAEKHYLALLRHYPNNLNVYEQYGNYLYKMKKYSEALKQLQNAEVLYPNSLDIKLKVAAVNLKIKRFAQAIEKLDYILQFRPEHETSIYYKALSHLGQKDYKTAQKILKNIPATSEFYDDSVVQQAFIEQQTDNMPEALKILETAYSALPDNELIISYLGGLYEKEKRYEKATDIYSKYLKTEPSNENILYLLAFVYFSDDQKKKSIEIMKSIISLNPDHVDALNFLGYTYADDGVNLKQAEEYIKRAIKLSPNTGYIIDSLGWVYYKQGRLSEAIKHLELASELSPDNPTIREHLGDAYLKEGYKIKAIRTYERALELIRTNRENIDGEDAERRLKNKITGINRDDT